MKKLWLVGVVLFLSSSGVKTLQAFTQGACREDAMKFCQAAIPDEDKVKKCLLEHRTEVSPACQANIKETVDKKKDSQGSAAPKEKSSGY